MSLDSILAKDNIFSQGGIVHRTKEGVHVYDFAKSMDMRHAHDAYPIWLCPNGSIYFESFTEHPEAAAITELLIAIAEPVSRPQLMHHYKITVYSFYGACATGLRADTIKMKLRKYSKNGIPENVERFIDQCAENYGRASLVLQRNRVYIQAYDIDTYNRLRRDKLIGSIVGNANVDIMDESGDRKLKKRKYVPPLELPIDSMEKVKQRALEIDIPLLEEYDFKRDVFNASLGIEKRKEIKVRPYQEKSLSLMFRKGTSRSGVVVLPCGAGKTCVGIMACSRVSKSCMVLCSGGVAVNQWRQSYFDFTTVRRKNVVRFTADMKEDLPSGACVCITTYAMLTFSGERTLETQRILKQISEREWGLLVLDEVHVVPAQIFRTALKYVHCHSKLGLTATLVREDDKISDINFLIGPKLYEANWMNLTENGYLAKVLCSEVRCKMARMVHATYLEASTNQERDDCYALNPNKFQVCKLLMEHHRNQGDKILIFADSVKAVLTYAEELHVHNMYGKTTEYEREELFRRFKGRDLYDKKEEIFALVISKIGDVAIDLPEANIIIQVSSHFASRRQEAQRLGRILRPQLGQTTAGYTSYFYSLVSEDTKEMYYASKRQQYLVNQGYTYKVVNDCQILGMETVIRAKTKAHAGET